MATANERRGLIPLGQARRLVTYPCIRAFIQIVTVLFVAFARVAQAGDAETDIPIVGRPTDLPFSEASGAFSISATADRTSVHVEEPVTLTVVVVADGPVHHPPQRIDLRQIPEFESRFYIEADDGGASPNTNGRRWEFVYRLKPRRVEVTEIPGVPFVFYNPAIRPASKAFQVRYTDPIPLQVQAAEVISAPPRPVADVFLQTGVGTAVIARQVPWSPPNRWQVWSLVTIPPVLCAAWFILWRRRYPDAGRLKERLRSRAARAALARLQHAEQASPEQRAPLTAAAVAEYLRERLDLTVVEPTPAEAAALLLRQGCTSGVVDLAVACLQACDAARFWPASVNDGDGLPALGREVILALDADTDRARSLEQSVEGATP
jgi:hypothetical protein